MDIVGHMQCGNQNQQRTRKHQKNSDTQVPGPDIRIAVQEKQQSKQRNGQGPNKKNHTFFFTSFASAALARSSHSVVLMNELL